MWTALIGRVDAVKTDILIESSVLELISKYRQNKPQLPESGGILLGYRRGQHLHIVLASPPQKSDIPSRFMFIRNKKYHQKLALNEWKKSNELMDYLGEWHTHPEFNPTPSAIDFSEWQILMRKTKKSLVFLIIGIENNIWLGLGLGQDCKILRSKVQIAE